MNRLELSRRQLLGALAAGWLAPRAASADPERRATPLTLGIGNYGLQSLKVEEAVDLVSRTGFDSLELSLMAEWDSAPPKLSAERRREIRQRLADTGLRLTSLMEDLHPSADAAVHRQGLDRLKQAADLGHDLSPAQQPLIQTVLGGGTWESQRKLFVERLADWRKVGEECQTVIAIKPHRSGAMSQPAQGIWLLEQLGNPPELGLVYDYSHYAFRDLPLEETVRTAAPRLRHVAVKDVRRKGTELEFALPGETGTIDYPGLLTTLTESGYAGDICCEVSSQVFRKSGYDPLAATRLCYDHMSRAFEQAGIPRPPRQTPR